MNPDIIDFNKLSTDPDYCLNAVSTAKSLKVLNELFDQLAKNCSLEVAKKLYRDKRVAFKLQRTFHQEFGIFPIYLLNIMTSGLPYEEVIRDLITRYQREDINREQVCKIIAFNLLNNIEFRNAFVLDKKFRLFFGEDFDTNLKEALTKIDKSYSSTINLTSLSISLDPAFIKQEIKNTYDFKDPLKSEENDILAIAEFLSNKDAVLTQLDKLEKLLKEKKGKMILEKKHEDFDKNNPKMYKHHKLLSGFLYEWAEQNNFGGYARFLQTLDPVTVFKLFEQSILFKDIAFRGSYHGEWTHFLQWYCLAEANNDNHFLLTEPARLLHWLGTQPSDDQKWDRTFEGDTDANSNSIYKPKFDARSFEKFNKFLLSNECKNLFPTLHELIYSRSLKDKPKNDTKFTVTKFKK